VSRATLSGAAYFALAQSGAVGPDGLTFLQALTYGLHEDEPRSGTNLPYAVLADVREAREPSCFEGGHDFRGRFELIVYAKGRANAEALAARAVAILEIDGAVDVAGREQLYCQLETYRVRQDESRSTEARRVTEVRCGFLAWSHG
jgi:hypothetical protein